LSASPAEIVEPFAELLGVTGAISSRAKIDELGKFTGEMEFFAQGENKAIAIRELAQKRDIDLNESFAYSDSETDIPMLESVGHAYAVERRSSTRQGGPRKSMADTEFQASGAGPRPNRGRTFPTYSVLS